MNANYTPERRGLPLRLDPLGVREAAARTLSRAALAVLRSTVNGGSPLEIAVKQWGSDEGRSINRILTRAASAPAMTSSSSGWADPLAHLVLVWLGLIAPVSASAALLGRGLTLSFEGAAAISVPRMQVGRAGFVAQGAPIGVAEFPTATVTMEPHKIAWISVLSREMILSSDAEAITRQVLVESAAQGLDAQVFSANPASAVAPAGILNGVPPLTASNATSAHDALTQDLSALGGAVARVAGNALTYIAAPEQQIATRFRANEFTFDVLASAALPAGTVVCVASNALASAWSPQPEIEGSVETAVLMADPAAEFVTDSGTVGQPIASLYQSDNVALKMRMWASWALRAPGAIAWTQNTNW
jgi:hypothetical protein